MNSTDSGYDRLKQDRKPKGNKLDEGKNRLGLVLGDFSRALWAIGQIGTKGAVKYSPGNWLKVPEGKARYTDAMLRHLTKEFQGEHLDPELELPHAAAVAWNSLARLELILREIEKDGDL